MPVGIVGIDAQVAFSPHGADTAQLASLAHDIAENTTSSLLYSLAFLYQTTGPVRDAITKVTENDAIFVYGMSDRKVGGLDFQKPNGNLAPVSPATLNENVPAPFKAEPSGGKGIRLHHKFAVIDFDKPTARVWTGSYNFSDPADTQNGENLLLVKDRRVATAYMVEALRLFDHYHFRLAKSTAADAAKPFILAKPARAADEAPWWREYYETSVKVRDREMFA